MTANNGWAGKPWVPLNPERDGWHWLEDTVDGLGTGHIEAVYYAAWSVPTWYRSGNRSPIKNPENWIYLGPVLSHDQVTALRKRVAELEEALRNARARYIELSDKDAAEAMAEIINEALGDVK